MVPPPPKVLYKVTIPDNSVPNPCTEAIRPYTHMLLCISLSRAAQVPALQLQLKALMAE